MTPDNKRRTQRIIKYGALAVWGILIALIVVNKDRFTVDLIIHYTPSNLFLAALVLLLLFALKTLSVFFYSAILYTVSGLLFSLPAAFAVNSLGLMVMITEGYLMGRVFGSDLMSNIAEKHPKIRPILHLQDSRPFLFAFLFRMMKFINFDMGSMYFGATNAKALSRGTPWSRFRSYAAASYLAVLPELIIYAVLGHSISSLSPAAAIAAAVLYISVTIASLLVIAWLVRHPEKL